MVYVSEIYFFIWHLNLKRNFKQQNRPLRVQEIILDSLIGMIPGTIYYAERCVFDIKRIRLSIWVCKYKSSTADGIYFLIFKLEAIFRKTNTFRNCIYLKLIRFALQDWLYILNEVNLEIRSYWIVSTWFVQPLLPHTDRSWELWFDHSLI